MKTSELLSSIDSEIARLQQVRSLLASDNGHLRLGKRRILSADARARIAAAQKVRWAKQKRAAKR